jgi:hypothetical protein
MTARDLIEALREGVKAQATQAIAAFVALHLGEELNIGEGKDYGPGDGGEREDNPGELTLNALGFSILLEHTKPVSEQDRHHEEIAGKKTI